MDSDSRSIMDLAKEVQKDQVLSAKIIRLCNSALISPKTKIDSIDRAIVLLGEEQLLRMVLATSLGDFYPRRHRIIPCARGFSTSTRLALPCYAKSFPR